MAKDELKQYETAIKNCFADYGDSSDPSDRLLTIYFERAIRTINGKDHLCGNIIGVPENCTHDSDSKQSSNIKSRPQERCVAVFNEMAQQHNLHFIEIKVCDTVN